MSKEQPDTPVRITLSLDEALVLFGWLSRVNDSEELRFEHQAEQRVLWDIECILESKLTEPLLPHYRKLLEAARERVADQSD